MNTISNQPPKGTRDWEPDEYKIRKYIFDTWRRVCESFGYEEYLTPIFENAEIYKAKSGEDIGGKELMMFQDKALRELAIRPEMTPSVTRLVSKDYERLPKPIRYFSIANFVRNEKPQRGRNREFWQLNFDLFGSEDIDADVEILQIALEIMLAFKPPKGAFTMYINDRKLIEYIITKIGGVESGKLAETARILDKFEKLDQNDIRERLNKLGIFNQSVDLLIKFMQSKTAEELLMNLPELKETKEYKFISNLVEKIKKLGYSDWVKFNPSVIRGFDYYDGMVFEVFDNNPENSRSLFGGGRYNGLASIFGGKTFPAVGCAPGDETTKLFLEAWNLLPKFDTEVIFIPLLNNEYRQKINEIAQNLRRKGKKVEEGLEEQNFKKVIGYADKKGFAKVLILGENEYKENKITVKDMKTGEQKMVSVEETEIVI